MKHKLLISIILGAMFGSFIGAGVANAQGLTITQVSAIISLLQAFGVDQQTISIVEAEMSTTTVATQTQVGTTTASTTIQGFVDAFTAPVSQGVTELASCTLWVDSLGALQWNISEGAHGTTTYSGTPGSALTNVPEFFTDRWQASGRGYYNYTFSAAKGLVGRGAGSLVDYHGSTIEYVMTVDGGATCSAEWVVPHNFVPTKWVGILIQ